jgi:NAD-dependent dihydropyrimidine dehydrogenase PreA subunit
MPKTRKEMSMKIFYFTATGNCLYVAKRIGGELYSIPQMIKEEKFEFEADAIGLVFPCYGFGVPRLVQEFIQKSSLKASYFFAIMTYGNKAASGLQQMEQIAIKAGIKFNYTNEILMIDNYLPIFNMEEQVKKETSKKIEEKLEQIGMDLAHRENKLIRKGLLSKVISKGLHRIIDGLSSNYGHKHFIVQDQCNGCQVCEKVCPVSNIRVAKKPEFAHQCQMCLACIHHCPANALHLKSEKSKTRFINQHVQLKEIIDANHQI